MKNTAYKILVNSFLFSINLCGANFFLQCPQKVKKQDFSKDIVMCWSGKSGRYTFSYDIKAGLYIKIECQEIPKYLDEKTKALFKKTVPCAQEEFLFTYTYGRQPEEWQVQDNQQDNEKEVCYTVEERRIIPDAESVEHISIETLATFIKTHNVIFYTGAGISAAAKIFTMHELEEALGISNKQNPQLFRNNDLSNPEALVKTFTAFCNAMFNNPPTKAHECLTKIAMHKQCSIVTENIDNLHQQTGIKPYTIQGNRFKREVEDEWVKDIDAIICCGLSYDDRGFLGWYKKHNPNGSIIAIDLETPHYLGTNDYLLTGDLQEIIPQLYDTLTNQ